jgi:hypothetical protein
MKKIPTLFKRDWSQKDDSIIDPIHSGCEWMLEGQGAPTRKSEGTASIVDHGELYKHYDRNLLPILVS